MTESSTSNSIENPNPLSNNWMAELYVLQEKSFVASLEAKSWRDVLKDKTSAHRALDIANKVEKEFMVKPDFENIRNTDQKYQQLVEEFAMYVGSDILFHHMNPINTSIGQFSKEQSYREQAEKFKERADKIVSEHNTPLEKAKYTVFAIRSITRELIKPINANKAKLSKGVIQLFSEMKELDKQKGNYSVSIGVTTTTETLSRLEALSDRPLYSIKVKPISPTPRFLTKDKPSDIGPLMVDPNLK
jgi:hypothetical protein